MKVAIITGTSRGLGLTLAREFSTNGWRVVGTGRSLRPADLPQEVAYHRFDAGDAAACEQFWQQIKREYPGAQLCLVNNAGGYVSGSLTTLKPEDYEQQMRSTYFAAVYMTRGLVLVTPKARIINVISTSALAAHKNDSAYGASKVAEKHFFHSIQQELNPMQYQITNLYPSYIASSGPTPNAMEPEDLAAFIRQQAENSTTYYLSDATLYPA